MFVVSRRVKVRSLAEAAKRAEAGLAPILKRSPGFRGYYVIDGGDGVAMSIAVFESQQDAEAVREDAIAWVGKNLTPLFEGEPLMTSGEVIVSVTPDAPRSEAGTGAAAEARPH